MIKEKELLELRPEYRYMQGQEITLDKIQNAIQNKALSYQIPVGFYNDQIKTGGLLDSQTMECLVLYHPEHKNDYYKIVVSIKRQGTVAFVSAKRLGESKNLKKLDARHGAASAVRTGWNNAGKIASEGGSNIGLSLGAGLLAGAVKSLEGIGGSKKKQEEENQYYSIILQILDNVIC